MRAIRTALAATAGAVILSGCELPTEAPLLQQRWILPVEETTLGVDELLPSGVSVSGSDFAVTVDPFITNETLGTLCALCAVLNGTTAPVPAFIDTFTTSQTLPADVSSVTVTSGLIAIAIQNGFTFDPLSGGGTLTITLTDGQGGAQLGQTVVDGASESLSPGATTNKTLTIAPGSVVKALFVSAVLDAPGGATTLIDTSDLLTITATPTAILVGSITMNVANVSVNVDPVPLNVSGLDSSATDRIQQGSVILDVVNPFGVGVSGTLFIGDTLSVGGALSKSLSIGSGATSQATISYTGVELQSFLGQQNVTFSASGTVTSGGDITVSPGQEMTIEVTVDVILEIG